MNNHRSPFSFFFLATSVRFLLERFLLSSGTSCGYSWKHQSSIVDDFIFFFQTFLSYISKKKKKKKSSSLYSFSPIKNDSLKKFLPTIRPTNYRIALRLKILKNLDRKEFLKLKKYRAYPRSVVKLIN